jgi:hypothetical protein
MTGVQFMVGKGLIFITNSTSLSYSVACPQVADGGEGLQVWRVDGNVMNNQLQIADNGWSSRLEVVWGGLTAPH